MSLLSTKNLIKKRIPISNTYRIISLFLLFSVIDLGDNTFKNIAHAETKKTESEKKPAERNLKRKKKVEKKSGEEITTPAAKEESTDFPKEDNSGQLSQVVDTVLILDSSRSMKKTDPNRLRDQGAKLFLQFLEAEDRISIIEFSDQSNTLLPLTTIKEVNSEEISVVLSSIKDEGNFTNFLSPLSSALEVFVNAGREGVPKVVIFLTDGQMDPSPDPAERDTLLSKLMESTLPEYEKQGIKIFTLALSSLADRLLLDEISKKTGGLSSYAEDVNTIHKVFSDLFLTIKRPQVLELEKGGFQIDNNTQESTFFINRKEENDTVTIIDPTNKEFVNKDFPNSWKWFRGDLFDIITIPKPLPGRWLIRGGQDDLSGFAKLLSNLKLEYSFPGPSFSVGDKAILKARMVEDGKILDSKELQGLIFFTYRIINTTSGQIYDQGQLFDNGELGDETASDFVFSNIITLNEENDYKLFLAANGPTFVRQAQIPISVSRGIISIEHIPENEFIQKKDSYQVHIQGAGKKLTNKNIVVQSKVEGNDKIFQINLESYKVADDIYEIPINRLNGGKNKIKAILNGINNNKEKISAQTEEIEILVPVNEENNQNLEEIKTEQIADITTDEEGHKEESPSYYLYGIISILISTVISFIFGKFMLNKSNSEGGVKIVVREPYNVPTDLTEELSKLRKDSTSSRRPPYDEEIEIFKLVPEISDFLNNKKESPTQETISESTITSTDTEEDSESTQEIARGEE